MHHGWAIWGIQAPHRPTGLQNLLIVIKELFCARKIAQGGGRTRRGGENVENYGAGGWGNWAKKFPPTFFILL